MPKKVGALCFAILFFGLLEVAVLSQRPKPRPVEIDGATVVRVRVGMSEAEMLRTLGVPPGDYRTEMVTYPMGARKVCGPGPFLDPRGVRQTWLLNSKYVAVYVFEGKVEGVDTGPSERPAPKTWKEELHEWADGVLDRFGM